MCFLKIHDIFFLYFHLILQAKTHFKRKDFYIHGLLQTRLHRLPKHPLRHRRHLRSDCPPLPETQKLPSGRLRPPHRQTRPKHPRRILNASGILSGATSFETYDQQKILLESEGVTVIRTDKGWKTDLKKYQWKTTLDDALYFESVFKQNNI